MSSETDAAWAAGLFDGEGTFTLNKSGGRLYPVVSIGQVGREVLDRFQEIVGVGKVFGPYTEPSKPNKQPIYQYRAHGEAAMDSVLRIVYPYLGTVKRADAVRVWTTRTPKKKGVILESKMLDEEAVDVEAEGSLELA